MSGEDSLDTSVKDWQDISDAEKIQRLADIVAIQGRHIDKLIKYTKCMEPAGCEVMYVHMNNTAEDRWLGTYRGKLSKNV